MKNLLAFIFAFLLAVSGLGQGKSPPGISQSKADARYLRGGLAQIQVVGTRSSTYASTAASNGTNTWANSMVRMRVPRASHSLRVRYANIRTVSGQFGGRDPSNAPGTITVKAAIWKLVYSGLVSGTGTVVNANFPVNALVGRTVVATATQQSGVITANLVGSGGATTFTITWPSGAPANGAAIKIYDVTPLTWAGQTSVTLAPDQVIDTDDSGLATTADDELVWIRTNVSVSSGTWPGADFGGQNNTYDEWTNTGTGTNSDLSTSGFPAATSASSPALVPTCLLGIPYDGSKPAILLDGDSRVYGGTGDTTTAEINGVLMRIAAKADLPWFAAGVPGATIVSGEAGLARNKLKTQAAKNVRAVFMAVGINDANSSIPLADQENSLVRSIKAYAAQGLKVVVAVPMPQVTSSDGWITADNQHPQNSTWETTRAGLASWMTSGAMNTQAGGKVSYVWDATSATTQLNSSSERVYKPASLLHGQLTIVTVNTTPGSSYIVVRDTSLAAGATYAACADLYTPVALDSFGNTYTPAFQARLSASSTGAWIQSNASVNIQGTNGRNTQVLTAVNSAGDLRLNTVDFASAPTVGETIDVYQIITIDGLHLRGYGAAREVSAFPIGVLAGTAALAMLPPTNTGLVAQLGGDPYSLKDLTTLVLADELRRVMR